MDKICPLMSYQMIHAEPKIGDWVICQKEKCALWLEEVSTDPGIGPKRTLRRAGCSFLITALGVHL